MYSVINNLEIDFEYEKDIEFILKNMAEYYKLDDSIFNVIIVDNKQIQELNKEYRNIDKPTDVISFALEDFEDFKTEIRVLGDIYISLEKAKEQALEYNHSLKRELSFLTVHGMLHLLGYDHINADEEKIMFDKQDEILNNLGIKRGEE